MMMSAAEGSRKPAIAYMLGTFPNLTETFVMREIEGLRARGFEVAVIAVKRSDNLEVERSLCAEATLRSCTYARPDNLTRHLLQNLIQLIRHPGAYLETLWTFVREAPRLPPWRFARVLYHFYCGIGFVRELRRRGVQHMHCHFQSGIDMALAVNQFSGIPFSFSAHATNDIYNRTGMPLKIERAEFVAPVCEYNRRYLDSLTRFKWSEKLQRVYNGIDVDEPRRLLGPELSGRVSCKETVDLRIVAVGSLVKAKGHATLITACDLLAKRGYRVVCEIIGAGPEQETLERILSQREVDGVALRGPLSLRDVYLAMASADVFALLSEVDLDGVRDGFPTVILEAMAVGLPVVSTWISGTPEMVVHGETGFLVHERDAEAAADALERLIRDSELRRQFGEAGRLRVRRLYRTEESVGRLVELLVAAIARGKGTGKGEKRDRGTDGDSDETMGRRTVEQAVG